MTNRKARPKQERKTRGLINKHYSYIDKGANGVADDQIDEGLQALMGDKVPFHDSDI